MIERFHVLYVGQIELDDVGLNGTPANDRRYSNQRSGLYSRCALCMRHRARPQGRRFRLT